MERGDWKKNRGTDVKMSETESVVHGFAAMVEDARLASKGRFWSMIEITWWMMVAELRC